MTEFFRFELLGQRFCFQSADISLQQLVRANWGHVTVTQSACQLTDVCYRAERQGSQTIVLTLPDGRFIRSADTCGFLYQLERQVIIELQNRRPELYFLHAAAGERNGKACLLIATSGSGKSTTQWALLHHGFRYLSDELAPIDLDSMQVHAYPHALCLKQRPPLPYELPRETVETCHSLHVPVSSMPLVAERERYSIALALFLEYRPTASAPAVRPLSIGEISARLYANALNQLAHPNAGLHAATHIAEQVPGYLLESADLTATCELVGTLFAEYT